jgi:hypothetical protein
MTVGELLLVVVTDVLGDVRALFDDARSRQAMLARAAPGGWSVGGLVVVRRITANRRRLTSVSDAVDAATRGSRWIAALRGPRVPLPAGIGMVWMDARGTRLLPAGLRLRGV